MQSLNVIDFQIINNKLKRLYDRKMLTLLGSTKYRFIFLNLKHVDERKSYIEYQNFASNIKIL